MPRKSRIDAPGALHHVIARGIARREIFLGNQDRDDFLKRLGEILSRTNTACYAWALIPNHFHLLLRTGTAPLSSVMKRLLTGYAVGFNLRHRRQGHLFQNRYKSILCQEDPYLLELVRYIHLNPLRAGLVKEYEALCRYTYSGHSTILGRKKRDWLDVEYILRLFGDSVGESRRRYRKFVRQGMEQGNRPELVGGGLLRSQGGWTGVKALRESGDYQKGDERILGEGAFVEQALREAEELFERRHRLHVKGYDLERVAKRVSELMDISPEEVLQPGRVRGRLRLNARNLLCFWATAEIGMKQSQLAGTFGLTQPAISIAVKKGEDLTREHRYSLEE
ncbi:MAG: transposase [Desulfobacterales bacterium]|nr:transposase [Desulfobacterales bacterium]